MTTTPKLRDAEIPWCATFLILSTIACHACVLVGNVKFSSAMEDLGKSTAGWSGVGLGLARSFQDELDGLMANVSADMVNVLEKLTNVTSELDTVLSIVGNTTDNAVAQGTGLFLLQVQASNVSGLGDLTAFLKPMVMKTVSGVVKTVTTKLNTMMDFLWLKVKPVLLQIGVWLSTFGTTLTSGMETFSNSLDKVQKIFDQIMAQLNGNGNGADEMLHTSFGLFDVSGTKYVTVQDLKDVSQLYSINALAGDKPEELIKKYDTDGDMQMSMAEMKLLVDDESIPNSMSTVLRAFAKKLSEVSGKLSRGTMRDQVALAVVNYFQLVCAQNQTKVTWVSDALGNGSLPLDFTSALFAQLCLQDGSVEALTKANIGKMVIGRMYELHPGACVKAYNNMVNTTYWTMNGFNLLDQPQCIKKVGGWITQAQQKILNASLLQVDATNKLVQVSSMMAEFNVKRHLQMQERQRQERHAQLFAGKTSQMLLLHLTGGQSSSSKGGAAENPLAAQAINAGQPAKPETLLFAARLSGNATGTVDALQELCFSYSSKSSSTLDNFATQIQGMIKKATSFINMMMKYSTTSAIDNLEKIFKNFMNSTESDLMKIIQGKLSELIDQTAPILTNALGNAVDQVSDRIGDLIADMVSKPLSSGLEGALGKVTGKVLGNSSLGNTVTDKLTDIVSGTLANKTSDMISDQLKTVMEGLINKAITGISSKVMGSSTFSGLAISSQMIEAHRMQPSLLETGSTHGVVESLDISISGTWQMLLDQVSTLSNVIPAATTTLKNAREDIQKAAANLDSIFVSFKAKGPPIFNLISMFWTLIWVLYFLFFVPLMLFNLYYAWWASGWFGGPKPSPDNDGAVPPRGWCDRLRICCSTCGVCMTQFHDTQCCFWSMVILMQVLVLVLFVISIVLCILAGIKAFLVAGCAQVYLLGDALSCQETILTLKSFVSSFFVQQTLEKLASVCPDNNLMACQLITAKMKSSVILTTVFSFLATILSMQVIIESAIMHEQARYRRMFTKQVIDEQEAAEKSVFKP